MPFEVLSKDTETLARRGRLTTAHGEIDTPVFMPVGTQATVKAMRPEELKEMGTAILLANTYHLLLRPGPEVIKELGGLHRFMNWPGPILTDSGGYQVFSLAKLRRLKEEGVWFQSHLDGKEHLLSPEFAIEIQEALGSDVMMVLDECLPYPSERLRVAESMELTLRWARRSLIAKKKPELQLFAIVQGGTFVDLRQECLERLLEIRGESAGDEGDIFAGYALGGLSVGEPMELCYEMTERTAPGFPLHKPRYLMGVGMPEDLVKCIGYGIDMFDSVVPTRCARHGLVFTPQGRMYLRRSEFTKDPRPIMEDCLCYTCKNYSRAYLRHLSLSREILSAILNTLHNLHYYMNLLGQARLAIQAGEYQRFQKNFFSKLQKGDQSRD